MSELQPLQSIQSQVTAPVAGAELTLKQVSDRVNLVHEVLTKVMKENTHYGTVPGCGKKKVLLKPGADVLAMTFRLVPQFAVSRTDLANGHREYDVTCSMYSASGMLLGQGVGSASTMEKKYRYRKDESGHKAENEDIADVYNTVLKIAKKRAHIDATLTVTGAADLFTQDLIEDEDEPPKTPVAMPTAKTQAPPANGQPAVPADPKPSVGPVVSGTIDKRSAKDGGSQDRPWKRYGFQIAGEWYGTFDSKMGDRLMGVPDAVPVELEYAVDAKGYRNIVSIIEPQA